MSATSANAAPQQRPKPTAHIDSQSIAELADGAGQVAWSKAAGRYMPPTNSRHIDPASPEGRAIAASAIKAMIHSPA